MAANLPKPTGAFIGASWAALFVGAIAYFIGLFNASIGLGEKGYYVILMLYGLFSVVSLQKTVRDRQEELPVTDIYYGIAWFAVVSAIALMAIGLYNSTFTLAERGFYGMAYTLSLFAATAVQKNVRDLNVIGSLEGGKEQGEPWYKRSVSVFIRPDEDAAPDSKDEPNQKD